MALLVKGILSFPVLFTPKVPKQGTEPKYGVSVLLPPNDPQIPAIDQAVKQAQLETFPNGMPHGSDICFMPYDQKYQGKEYYDPRCSGWWNLACSSPVESKPRIVDGNHVDIIDPGAVFAGCVGYVHVNIAGYTKGRGGIGSFINGVMFCGEEGSLGRLDSKPSLEQMFGSVGQYQQATPQNAGYQPPQNAGYQPPQNAGYQPPARQMTPKAGSETYESMIARGWSDEQLIQHGYMLPPGGVKPSFM